MIRTTLRTVLALTMLGITTAVLASTPTKAQNQNMEVVHHPSYEVDVLRLVKRRRSTSSRVR